MGKGRPYLDVTGSTTVMAYDGALSLLLTGAQPDRHRQAKRQKLSGIPEAQKSSGPETASHNSVPASSRDPSEVSHRTDTLLLEFSPPRLTTCVVARHLNGLHAAQAANILRKQYQIHVKGSNVAPPLQVLMPCLLCTKPSESSLFQDFCQVAGWRARHVPRAASGITCAAGL